MSLQEEDPNKEVAIEQGNWLFSQACNFLIGAVRMENLPENNQTEIAFAGRSNVGKSSLINALANHKDLARTSNTPGRTQQVNFFNLGNLLTIVDLPGYGYARAPRETVRDWTNLIGDYLQGRKQLRRVCLLIDSRHGIKEKDRDVMNLMDRSAVSYQIILTKCDKIKLDQLKKLQTATITEASSHVAAHPELIATSSTKGIGIKPLRATLATLTITK